MTAIVERHTVFGVKTVQQNISLARDLRDFARAEASEQGYGSISAYFADLLRQRRQAQIEADVKFLASAMQDAPPGPEPMDQILAAQKRVRRQLRKERWQP